MKEKRFGQILIMTMAIMIAMGSYAFGAPAVDRSEQDASQGTVHLSSFGADKADSVFVSLPAINSNNPDNTNKSIILSNNKNESRSKISHDFDSYGEYLLVNATGSGADTKETTCAFSNADAVSSNAYKYDRSEKEKRHENLIKHYDGNIDLDGTGAVRFDMASGGVVSESITSKIISKATDKESLTKIFKSAVTLEGAIAVRGMEEVTNAAIKRNSNLEIKDLAFDIDMIIAIMTRNHISGIMNGKKDHDSEIDTKGEMQRITDAYDKVIRDNILYISDAVVVVTRSSSGKKRNYERQKEIYATPFSPFGDADMALDFHQAHRKHRVLCRETGARNDLHGINADLTYIHFLQKDIDISRMLGIGTSICIRGPSPGPGRLTYKTDFNNVLFFKGREALLQGTHIPNFFGYGFFV